MKRISVYKTQYAGATTDPEAVWIWNYESRFVPSVGDFITNDIIRLERYRVVRRDLEIDPHDENDNTYKIHLFVVEA